MFLTAALRWVKTSSIWTSRALAWTLIGVAFACAALVLSLRYWFLPNIENYREDIAAAVSRAANVRITIGRISGDWEGMRPHLKLEDVSVYDKAGRRALELSRVESTLAWRSLAVFNVHFHALDIHRPSLAVRRDARGVVSIAGIELQDDYQQRGGFVDWVLQQPRVEVHDAAVSWSDELRGAPPLELSGVNVQILNRGSRHRFGIRAVPPPELAAPIDLRGDLRGDTLDLLSDWNGKLFVQVEHVDLAQWSPWIDIPIELARGAGAMRTWLTYSHHALAEIIADVRLAGVRTRLRKDLPELELDQLGGRLAWKNLKSGFEFSAAKLALTAGGAALEPANLLVRITADRKGTNEGEVHASALNLAPLAMLADRLPVEDELRTRLLALSPRGTVHDLVLKWKGAWPEPEQYSARGRFEALAFERWGSLPAVSGLSGNIDGSEKGGTLHVNSQGAGFVMPDLFGEPIGLDTLTAQVAWTREDDQVELRFSNVSFANADAAGTVFGSYRSAREGRGEIDLTGNLSRADARRMARYVPVTVLRGARAWLERALVSGHWSDVRFKVKGRLEDFPFREQKRGIFHVIAKVTDGTLDYAQGWPRIENIEGDLQLHGIRMAFLARQGTIQGVKLAKVQCDIPDLTARTEMLTVSGEAEGASSEFLDFIAKTPVNQMVDRFTEGIQAQGRGRLALKLTLPLGELPSTKVTGSYQFINNQVAFERELPPLEQANGRIEFTESTVRVPGVTGVFLGGPVTIAANERDATMRATLQGRVNADNVRKAGGPAWMQHLRGTADWRGVLTLHNKIPDLVIESNLQGVSSSLPAPFAKTAAEAVPLRIERRSTGAQQDRISFAYGEVVKAELARVSDGKDTVVERGVVRLGGGEAGEPERRGIWVRGALKSFNFDDWLAFSRGGEDGSSYTIAGADVKLGQVDFLGRRFNELALTAVNQGEATQLTLAGREIEGAATWRGEGKGRLTARLKKLTLPAVDDKAPAPPPKPPGTKPPELPALDVVVDQFQQGQKQLGRLELTAVHQDRDWRIERMRISSADSVLTADGIWQGWQTQPRTQLNVRMDVIDIGKTLARWGYPPGVRGGTAKIEGQLAWAGSPQDFDYPTLTGKLAIEAANGQFAKLEPGLAKLFGILSLQSLPRRASLDFRDVFSQGFSFDGIAGALKIERGIASTEHFRMQGPSARVLMSGEVDLARETQKLRVRVTPHLSESVSIAGALIGGPVGGVAAFLAQKILKDPIEKLTSFEYNVTGSWSDPQIAKLERAAPAITEGSP